ncbi:hypothetical protein AGDE_01571 [Angomonas deanei]|nr:hypothetical protein AGDE_01571 [Angomonas deanei]|eukprot:EPY42352.1 hypothetical protein AGDE_01571 [Angomonas deanei]
MLCALLTVWMALIGVNFLFSLLKNVVLEPYLTGETDTPRAPALQCTVQNIQQWGTRLPVALFALEFFSAVMTWVYFLFFSGNFELGALMTLPAFFASMYDSLALEGVEPDRAAVWVTHFLFLLSLFFVFSLGTPYIIREWREAKKELQNHTQKALFKDRDEVRELKERLDIMKTKNGTVLRKRK